MVELAIALGIAINLVLSHVVGFSAAGLVVPGYLALYFGNPARLGGTLAAAVVTWAIVRWGLERLLVLYGRRRVGVTVLVGFLVNAALEASLRQMPGQGLDLRVIGYIVPGLIANESLSQGLWPTLTMTLTVSALVRLVLVVALGWTG